MDLYSKVCYDCSRLITHQYSTSFSFGIRMFSKELRMPVYAIYGFVRFADEIVDTFHEFDKEELLTEFRNDTYKAIDRKISMNPILNSFQQVVNDYNIERELIDCFLDSMAMDLAKSEHNLQSYEKYILGSAEVVGLMCLRVFTERDEAMYQALKPSAMRLGSAFQKVNFLRDLKADYQTLGRVYFPQIDMKVFSEIEKLEIEKDIQKDFDAALEGIKKLPRSSRFGVYVAYVYYVSLFKKIKSVPSYDIMKQRVRVPNYQKMGLLAGSYLKHSFSLL